MTATKYEPLTTRPDENDDMSMSVGVQWIIVGGFAAAIGFFLPWVKMTGFFNSTETGYGLAGTTESAASGMNLSVLWVTLAAAILILLTTIPAVRRSAGVWGNVFQIVLAAAAVVPIWLVVPDEISYWSGGETGYSYGLWITVTGFAVVAIAAFAEALIRRSR